MTELADIFNQYGDTYRTRYGERMLPSHQVVYTDPQKLDHKLRWIWL
jgi:hypothetical protein